MTEPKDKPSDRNTLIAVLLQSISYAGWDLSKPAEVIDFIDTLQLLKEQNIKKRGARERWITRTLTVLGTIGTGICGYFLPKILETIEKFVGKSP